MPIASHPRRSEAERMLRAGRPTAEVAAATGASQRAVRQWARKLGLPRQGRGRGAEAEVLAQEVLSRLLAGEQPAQIALALEITPERVRQIRGEFDLTDEKKK